MYTWSVTFFVAIDHPYDTGQRKGISAANMHSNGSLFLVETSLFRNNPK